MSPRHRLAAAFGAALVATLVARAPASAHAIGGTFQLPVPLWLYLAAAAVAVTASFVVTSLVTRRTGDELDYPRLPFPAGPAALLRTALRFIGVAWWYGAIAVGFLIGDISPLPAVLFWIGIWVGLPIVAALLGNPWPSLSPFRTTFGALDWAGRRAGLRRLDASLPYPAALGRWPAVVLLGAGIWDELMLPGSAVAPTVAWLMLAYTAFTLAGMLLFGQIAWLRNAEVLEVELAWFGRVGPIGRRSAGLELCDGCTEGCDPPRCVDCPECATAAADPERRPELRPWLVGLAEVRRAGWSDAAFIVLALAGVSYDGMRETAFGAALLNAVLPPVQGVFGTTGTTFLVVDTLALILVALAFVLAFGLIVAVTHRLSDPAVRRPIAAVAGAYAATLLPIAAGYLVAHYLTLVIQAAAWLPSLIADPLMSLAPELDWIPTGLVWYLSVAAIVIGHVAAIVLAHRHALRDAPARSVVSGLPMVGLMIGYTVLSLWIIAQPIVLEPGMAAGR